MNWNQLFDEAANSPDGRAPGGLTDVRDLLCDPTPLSHQPGEEIGGAVAKALIDWLQERSDAARLLVLKERASDKKHRKLAGKALYRLSSRGIEVPTLEAVKVGSVGSVATRDVPSVVASADSQNDFVVLFCAPMSRADDGASGMAIASINTSLELPLLEVADEASRTRLRDIRKNLQGFASAEVPAHLAEQLILRGAQGSLDAGKTPPLAYNRACREFGWNAESPWPTDATVENDSAWGFDLLADVRAGLGEDVDLSPLQTREAIDTVLSSKEARMWRPTEDGLRTLSERLSHIADSVVIVESKQVPGYADTELGRWMDDYFTADSCLPIARNFEVLALLEWQRGHRDGAILAIRAAATFAAVDGPPSESLVLRAFVERSIPYERMVEHLVHQTAHRLDEEHACGDGHDHGHDSERGEAGAEAPEEKSPIILP